MPTRFSGKLLRFLFAHLELATFGERLLWLDRQAGIFQILWKHGNHVTATPEEDNAVFTTWHDAKQRRKPCGPMQAKQRFRVAARKMHLEHLKCWRDIFPSKYFQYWRFPPDDLAYLLKNADLDRCENWKCAMPRHSKTAAPAWWEEMPAPQPPPVMIKQEPMSEPETETETETETESESESESESDPEPEPQQEVELEVIKAEVVSEPETDDEAPVLEAEPDIRIKTEPDLELVTEPEPQPKTVQRMEVPIGQSKPPPANRESSPPRWQRRPRRCPRKCFCCMEP